jgi:hypothetical protein
LRFDPQTSQYKVRLLSLSMGFDPHKSQSKVRLLSLSMRFDPHKSQSKVRLFFLSMRFDPHKSQSKVRLLASLTEAIFSVHLFSRLFMGGSELLDLHLFNSKNWLFPVAESPVEDADVKPCMSSNNINKTIKMYRVESQYPKYPKFNTMKNIKSVIELNYYDMSRSNVFNMFLERVGIV